MNRPEDNSGISPLAKRIGEFIEYWGYKRIHGEIWTHLYLSPHPLSAQDLILRLGVSKALVSLSIKDLLEHELILQTPDSLNKKNKFYLANPDIFGVIRTVLKNREATLISNVVKEATLLSQSFSVNSKEPIDPKKLKTLTEMSETAQAALKVLTSLPGLSTELLKLLFLKK
jgi:DNA-binding transcriptional regulator GbsR (MarR family)